MKIETFQVEKWMDEHETSATYNLAETCCASISVNTLLSFSNMQGLDALSVLTPDAKQTYGEIRGSDSLRGNLAGLYSAKSPAPFPKSNIITTPGAIAANFLTFYALLSKGDAVVCMYPTYQQLYSVPRSLGADVRLWKVKRVESGRKWKWDIEDLKRLVNDHTKMIILNNPNNPTGAILSKSILADVLELAKEKNILVLSDEVYRPIFHGIGPMDADFPGSALSSSYDRVIVTGSLSKAYGLAGIRVGWVACRSKEVIEQLAATRHYTTISVSALDQQIASLATSQLCLHGLLRRNIKLAKENVKLVDNFVDEYRECEWVRPVAGTTGFMRFARDGKPIDDVEFCERLQRETGVMLLPGSRGFADNDGDNWHGYVRIGYANESDIVRDGLEKLRGFMSSSYKDILVVDSA